MVIILGRNLFSRNEIISQAGKELCVNMYQIDFNHPSSIYFVGIGGISMSGLAEILLEEGFTISGSDAKQSALTDSLAQKGATIYIGQKASNLSIRPALVVYTAAIREDNEEFKAAVDAGIPMLSRAELLGQIMDNYEKSIAVAGTHGKTTTTSRFFLLQRLTLQSVLVVS